MQQVSDLKSLGYITISTNDVDRWRRGEDRKDFLPRNRLPPTDRDHLRQRLTIESERVHAPLPQAARDRP